MKPTQLLGSVGLLLAIGAAGACGSDDEGDAEAESSLASEQQALGAPAALPPGCLSQCESDYAEAVAQCWGDATCMCFADQDLRCCMGSCRGQPCRRRIC
jgi:hypothetical protein